MSNHIDNLVKRAIKGDEQAFDELIRALYGRILNICYQWCGSQPEADDMAQEICIKLADKLHLFRFDSSFETWLYRLAVNAIKDGFKAVSRQRNRDAAFAEHASIEGVISTQEDAAIARQTVDQIYALPLKYRDTILLVYAQGLSHAQAAEILECKEGTVSWRISEAKKMLSQ